MFCGVALLAITELLSIFGAVRRVPLLVAWLVVGVAAAVYARWKVRVPRIGISRDPVVLLCCVGIAAIVALTAVTAAYSPPNSADAMAYHMPRVVYWAEQGSVRFFPTPYFNQIMLQPLAEYFMLHTYVLSGGDRFVNFVQWFGAVGSIVGVSAIAREFGAGARGQAIGALFCATLPSGILASSGAKNDYFLAMWIVGAVYFAARFLRTHRGTDALLMGAALGLALLTKATAYLFAPWLLAAVVLPRVKAFSVRSVGWMGGALGVALAINAPHDARNFQLSGSVLGYDSAQGDGMFRWRNETFGWKQTVSNVLRNASEQMGARSERWNRGVYDGVVRAHELLGINANDPATTWRWSVFQPPRNANHEADANSRWHLLMLAIAVAWLAWRGEWAALFYALGALCGFLAFCAYLKWQPFETRLLLPLFVAASPLAGIAAGRLRMVVSIPLCLFFVSVARLPALENWVRPLEGPRNVWRVPREDRYFSDMGQWDDRDSYARTVAILAGGDCAAVGIDATNLSLEYPLMALLRERKPGTVFLHTGVQNASNRFRPPVSEAPCAVVCLNCAGDAKRESLYGGFPIQTKIDRFIVYRRR